MVNWIDSASRRGPVRKAFYLEAATASHSRVLSEILKISPTDFRRLSATEREPLETRLGARFLAEAVALAHEPDQEMFLEGLLSWGRRLEDSDRLEIALRIYSHLASLQGFEAIREQARRRIDAIRGRNFGERAEFLLKRLPQEMVDGPVFGGLVLGRVVGNGLGLVSLSRLFAKSPRRSLVSTAARALGFTAQIPAFALGSHLLRNALESSPAGHDVSFGSELRSTAFAMGGLGILGWSGALLAQRFGLSGAWGGTIFQQGGLLGGILLGRWLEDAADPKPRGEESTVLLDSLALLFNYHVAGRLLPNPWGRTFHAREAALQQSAASKQGSSFSFAFSTAPVEGLRGRPHTLSEPQATSALQSFYHPMMIHSPSSGSASQPPTTGSNAPAATSEAGKGEVPARSVTGSDRVREIPTVRVGIIGGGMAGLFSALALTHRKADIAESVNYFRTAVTLLTANLGGKVQPNNEGAQFIDASHSFPLVPWIHELGVETLVRPDYDLADLVLPEGLRLAGSHFVKVLDAHRDTARLYLEQASWKDLDQVPAREFIDILKHKTFMTDFETKAFEVRVGVEEGINLFGGTQQLSALSYAFNMAKSRTPMDRLEVVGGPYRMVEILGGKLRDAGADIRENTRVREVHVMREGVRVLFERQGSADLLEEMFDAAILAVAPEHLSQLKIEFHRPVAELPIDLLRSLPTARITKTNLVIDHHGEIPELVTPQWASWASPAPEKSNGLKMISFFHGINGHTPLGPMELLRAVFPEGQLPKVQFHWSRIWDPAVTSPSTLVDGYTTMPGVGQALPLARAVYRHYFGHRDFGPLWLANHALGLGCYMHNAALSGLLAARALMRSQGVLVKPISESKLFGVDLDDKILSQLK